MRAIIVEDEKHARDNLEKLLLELDPQLEIQAKIDTVKKTITWLQQHETDLIFLDIHLADDISFKIFEVIEVKTPIIFTTAYDQYALKAFKVNSVDYLLKPIDKEELAQSLDKYKTTQAAPPKLNMEKIQAAIDDKDRVYQKRFVVSRRNKILSVKVDDIAFFEGQDRYVYLHRNDGNKFIIDYTLSDLEAQLDPSLFFRLNRSFIAHFEAIEKITPASKSRVTVDLQPAASRDIIVSSANTRSFKAWLNK